jgi:glycosyltransferase involved in cell wall biosynthesis
MRGYLNIRGTVRGYTGYDNTVRSLVRALGRIGVEVGLADFPEWSNMPLPSDEAEFQNFGLVAPEAAPLVVQFCLPYQVVPFPGCRTVNFTMFELDRVPWFWLQYSLSHDHLIVPEESSRQAWLADAFPPERISVCHLGVDSERFRPGHVPRPLGEVRGCAVAQHRVRMLNVSAVQPRKNLLSLLRVWLEATRPDDDAVLILKLSYSGMTGVRLMRDLHLLECALGRTRKEAASILFLDTVLSDAEMPGLYAAATHYWSMSRGEGWDQPMTEAAASGLRLIAPNHTAYRTYLDPSIATLLPCRQELASRLDQDEPDPRIYRAFFTANPRWWEPDREAAIEAVRAAIEQRDVPVASARERMRAFSWEESARQLWRIAQRVLTADPATLEFG